MTSIELEVKGKPLSIETGRFAKQADGSVIIRYGDTVVLATAVAAKQARVGLDFFPLTVAYQEKTYAAGKIPGGFFKREGRPTEKEVLTSRLIDRPIRPLFPEGFYCETQVIVSVLSFGEENMADVLGVIGASAALGISDIPFEGPIGAVRIGIIEGSLVVNPDLKESEECDFTLVVAGSDEAVLMVEGGGLEIPESTLIEAIDIAHGEIKRIVDVQKDFIGKAGKSKREVTPPQIDEEIIKTVSDLCLEKIKDAIRISDKLVRQDTLDKILEGVIDELNTGETDISREISEVFNNIEKKLVRGMILDKNVRVDGRKPEDIRKITSEAGILPRTHGSALFTRGETQCL
ncbi:MAG TPA: polyribonucleotide nucleotidyltransferase, partial [Nitrospirae bacterium]|nr:polyribonucleotide nucleotidyltransferase [Nitrospirota bacterium]